LQISHQNLQKNRSDGANTVPFRLGGTVTCSIRGPLGLSGQPRDNKFVSTVDRKF